MSEFDAWFKRLEQQADTVIALPKFVPRVREVLGVVAETGKMPDGIGMRAESFAGRLASLIVSPVLGLKEASERKVEAAREALECLVWGSRCGFLHGMKQFFVFLERVFHAREAPLWKEHPGVQDELWRCVAKDEELVELLVKGVSGDVSVELVLTFASALLPALRWIKGRSYGSVCRAITKKVVELVEKDLRNTSGQVLFEVFELMVSDKVRDEIVEKWNKEVFEKALKSGIFDKVLMTLKCVGLLLDRDEYRARAVEWVQSEIACFKKVQMHDEFIKYLRTIWRNLGAMDCLEQGDLRELWGMHAVQSRQMLKPFFSIFSELAETVASRQMKFFIKIVLNPTKQTSEWVFMLEDLMLSLEKRNCDKEVAVIKKEVAKLSKTSGTLKDAAELVATRSRAICVSQEEFNQIIEGAVTKYSTWNDALICDLLDRRQIPSQQTRDKMLNVALQAAQTADTSVLPILCDIVFKLVTKHHSTFGKDEMTCVFRLAKSQPGGCVLLKKLMEAGRFPIRSFVKFVRHVKSGPLSDAFSNLVCGLYEDIKSVTTLPFENESLLWHLSAIDSRFSALLCSIYARNDLSSVPDTTMVNHFITEWSRHFEKMKRPSLYVTLLDTFISEIEALQYVTFKRHKMLTKDDMVCVRMPGEKPVYVDPDMTVCAFLQMVKGSNYVNYSMKANRFFQTVTDTMKSIAGRDKDIECEIVERPNDGVRIRTCFPSQIIANSSLMDVLYSELRTGKPELLSLMDRLPTYPVVVDEVRDVHQNDLERIFPVKYQYVFSYNFEVLITELDPQCITKECLDYLVHTGIGSCDPLLAKRILDYISKNWPLKIEVQTLFDTLVLLMKSSKVQNSVLLDALNLGMKIGARDLKMPKDINRVAMTLLTHSNGGIRSAAVEFLKTVPLQDYIFLHYIADGKGKLSSEFFSSLADHLTTNDKELGNYLVDLFTKGQEEMGHLHLMKRFVARKYFSEDQLLTISESILENYLAPRKSDHSPDLIKEVATLTSMFSTKPLEEYLTTEISNSSWGDWHIDGDSIKLNSGRVGLVNLGQTCFLNSILQQFFAVKELRQMIFGYSGDDQFMRALKLLYARMECSEEKSVTTQSLASRWIDWDGNVLDVHRQQDATEFALMLLDKLEGGVGSDSMSALFQGKLKVQIKTLQGKVLLEKEDVFSILPLAVQGLTNVEESLKHMSDPDFISGYKVDGKETDVQSITRIKSLPPHFIIQLKRFEYDYRTWHRTKISSPFSFPLKLELTGRSFTLRGVVVHRGSADFGHYFSYILDAGEWWCYNDESVTKTTEKTVMEEAKTLAYLLFYSSVDDDTLSVKPSGDILSRMKKERRLLHRKRILCSANLLKIMEGWACGGPSQASCAIAYMYDVLPFTKSASNCQTLQTNLTEAVKRHPDIASAITDSMSINSLVGCPIEPLRDATTGLVWTAFQTDCSDVYLTRLLDMLPDILDFPSNFDQLLAVMYKIVTYDESMRDCAIDNDLPKRLSQIISEDWNTMVEKKKTTYTETQQYERTNFTHMFRLLALFDPQPSINKLILDGRWIHKILKSKTRISALAQLIRSFDDVDNTLSTLTDYAKQHRLTPAFTPLLTTLKR